MSDNGLLEKIVSHIFAEDTPTIEQIQQRYPKRQLPEGAMVTRMAPSPTGFLHIGSVYAGYISERFAHQSEGVFYLRVEDTDTKRTVEGATKLIVDGFNAFGIHIDEGPLEEDKEIGDYGPYFQSHRAKIYHAYIKDLMLRGKAYVCFTTPETLEEIAALQRKHNAPIGYYGEHAIWRDRPLEDVWAELEKGTPYVIRFRSEGSRFEKIVIEDFIRGKLQLPENFNDVIIMKQDRLPTYHMAHAIDDTVMGTTHVTRGDEWIPSLPIHIQLFKAIGSIAPIFGHFAPIQKMDKGSRRKLSKRKDPEASVEYYFEHGIPVEAVKEYLLNLANSKFEEWRKANPMSPIEEYKVDPSNCNNSGALLDMVKLDHVAKSYISKLGAKEVYIQTLTWAKEYDHDFANLLEEHQDLFLNALSIERGGPNSRKDFGAWKEVKEHLLYFLPEHYDHTIKDALKELNDVSHDDAKKALERYLETYDTSLDSDAWLDMLRGIAAELGYATNMKEFKKAEEGTFKGHFGHIAMVLRVAITGKTRTPDLYSIVKVLGDEEVGRRVNKTLEIL